MNVFGQRTGTACRFFGSETCEEPEPVVLRNSKNRPTLYKKNLKKKLFLFFWGKKIFLLIFFIKSLFIFLFLFGVYHQLFIRLFFHPFVDERSLGRALHASRRTHARPPTRRLSDLRFVFALLLRLLRFSLQFVPTIWHKENQVVTMQELLL